jgi:LysM repeat protein
VRLDRRWLALPALGVVLLTAVALASELNGHGGGSGVPVAAPTVLATVQSTTVLATVQPTSAPTGAAITAPTPASGSVATGGSTVSPTAASTSVALGPPAPVPTAPAGGPYHAYTVQAGDNLHAIASLYGVSAASIAQASGLRNPDQLRTGQVLTIPNQNGILYRVQAGETLENIAARTGVSVSAIASASDLTAASVSPGQVILIPDNTSSAATVAGK